MAISQNKYQPKWPVTCFIYVPNQKITGQEKNEVKKSNLFEKRIPTFNKQSMSMSSGPLSVSDEFDIVRILDFSTRQRGRLSLEFIYQISKLPCAD